MTLIRIPTKFFYDHAERMLPTPEIVRQTKTHIWIDADDAALFELHDDAVHHAHELDPPDGIGSLIGLISSARATYRAIEAAIGGKPIDPDTTDPIAEDGPEQTATEYPRPSCGDDDGVTDAEKSAVAKGKVALAERLFRQGVPETAAYAVADSLSWAGENAGYIRAAPPTRPGGHGAWLALKMNANPGVFGASNICGLDPKSSMVYTEVDAAIAAGKLGKKIEQYDRRRVMLEKMGAL